MTTDFSEQIGCAAVGLIRRGLLPGDPVAVHCADADRFFVAIHAVVSAGGMPVPVPPGITADEAAERLTQANARMLIADAELARVALEATEASRVSQVFLFDTKMAGATPFGELVKLGAR